MRKRIILGIAIIMLGCGPVVAQSDGFFTPTYQEYRETGWSSQMPSLPGMHGALDDYPAALETPIGGGALLLAGMGMAYATMLRRNRKK